MRVESYANQASRAALTALIVSPEVLAQISPAWDGEGFASRWENLIAGWCVSHYNACQAAPGAQIYALFAEWAEKDQDAEARELVGKFLSSLSEEHFREAEASSASSLELARNLFGRVRLKRLSDGLVEDMGAGRWVEASERILSFSPFKGEAARVIDVFQDFSAIEACLAYEHEEPLVSYDQGLADFFGDSLKRDSFVAVEGSDKVGKSYWLLDIAFRAMLERRKVLYFEAGDLSQDQVMARFMVRAARRPLKAGVVRWPDQIADDDGGVRVVTKDRDFDEPLDARAAQKACQKLMRDKVKAKGSLFKLSCHPNSTLSVKGMQAVLKDLKKDGFSPDCIVVDYADILAPCSDFQGCKRDQIDDTWRRLRALSQEQKALVVTATQTSRKAYSAELITRDHFSDCKGKLAHVTGMVGINQTPDEKEQGLYRLNWVERRGGPFSERKCCYVGACLALAHPSVKSLF